MYIFVYLYLIVSPTASFVELQLEGLARTPHAGRSDAEEVQGSHWRIWDGAETYVSNFTDVIVDMLLFEAS